MPDPLTIAEAARQIRSGQVTPLELVERCLEQIDRYDDQVRAWVSVDAEGARRTARELGEEAAQGKYRGPLHGIPLGIKDIIDVGGFPTRAGSPLREDYWAWADAPLVASLRKAGAIILGKTVTVEFAFCDPPPTRNPWDPSLQHTPGGSSSGSAAAVAMGMCLGALGTQTGGSLVRPASYCGIAAYKPYFRLLSMEGIVPVSYHLDHPGPLARTAEDLDLMWRVLASQMVSPLTAGDLTWKKFSSLAHTTMEGGGPPTISSLRTGNVRVVVTNVMGGGAAPISSPRLGLLEDFFMEQADPAVKEVVLAALRRLRDAGASIEPVRLTANFREIQPMHRRIMAVEAAAYHRQQFAAHRKGYGPKITALLDEGLATSAVDYADALAHHRAFPKRIAPMFKTVDALIMPATETTAPASLETTGSPLFQAPWSYAGVPVVSIPCGLAADGMPVGLQLVADPEWRRGLLRLAQWCEQQLAFSARPPLWKE
jgi:aspartyl-tRNA(Asn)/glutamyl-tRNA(Gln) amidotransferase subunit A